MSGCLDCYVASSTPVRPEESYLIFKCLSIFIWKKNDITALIYQLGFFDCLNFWDNIYVYTWNKTNHFKVCYSETFIVLITITPIYFLLCHSKRKPVSINWSLPNLLLPAPEPPMFVLSLWIYLYWIFHVNAVLQCMTICMASFALHRALGSLFWFYDWPLIHWLQVPCFVYPFIHWWIFQLFPTFGYYKIMLPWTLL